MNYPVVFEYTDYRFFLRDLFLFRKKTEKKFSHRSFAQKAGFNTPNFLLLVIKGKRNLTSESMDRICKAFELNKSESDFFRNLVGFNQAKAPSEKNHFLELLSKSKAFLKLEPLKAAELHFYRHWFNIPVRELMAHKNFKNDPEWIARMLRHQITPAQARKSIETLTDLGFASFDENGQLRQAQPQITTGHEVVGSALVSFHKKMIELAKEAIDAFPKQEREISSSTLFISKSDFERLKKLIQDFRLSLLKETQETRAGSNHTVYQVNFQLFPISKAMTENE